MYEKAVLDNGLRIVTHEMPGMRSIALGIWIRVGGRHEGKINKGISHFLEHLIFKGSKKYSGNKIKESIEGVGGSLNGFTSEEFTCYLVKIPSQFLNLSFDILSDMSLNPTLDTKEVEKERTVIMEEIKMYRDMPQSRVYDLLDELLWPEQPLGMSIAGEIESVRQIKRKDLFSFKESKYTMPNIVIAACGRLESESFIDNARKKLINRPKAGENRFLKAKEKQTSPHLKILHKDTEQTHLALGFHGLSRQHPDKYALSLMHVIMGANMSSRLFNEIREKRGLAYEIGTHAKYFSDTGTFLVHAGIDNRKVGLTTRLILKELFRLKEEYVRPAELKRAKEFYLGQLQLALEDTLDHMLWTGELTATLDRIYTWDEISRYINSVTIKDIKRVACAVLKKNKINLSLIGPLKGQEKEINACLLCQ